MPNHIFIRKLEKKLELCVTHFILLPVESPEWLEIN